MQILSSILFVISANLDSLSIGISKKKKKIKITTAGNFLIATISSLGTFLSMSAGSLISGLISPDTANKIGSWILILFGLYFILSSIKNKKKQPEKEIPEEHRDVRYQELFLLSIALTVNNIGMGIGASIAGIHPLLASVTTFAVSLLFIAAGQRFGRKCLTNILKQQADILAGSIVLCLGILEFFI